MDCRTTNRLHIVFRAFFLYQSLLFSQLHIFLVATGGDGEGGDNSGKWISSGRNLDSTLKPATVSSWRPAKKVH